LLDEQTSNEVLLCELLTLRRRNSELESRLLEYSARTSDFHAKTCEILDNITDAFFSLDENLCYQYLNKTAQKADVVFPGVSFAEKDGTFSNTERRVQRIRQAISPRGEARPDWQIICELSNRLGYPMNYNSVEEIFEEIRTVAPSYAGMTYARLEEAGLQWPCPSEDHPGTPVLHGAQFSRGLGLFSAIEFREAAELPDAEYPPPGPATQGRNWSTGWRPLH